LSSTRGGAPGSAAGAAVPPGSGAGTGGRLTGIGGADFLVSKGVIDIRGLSAGFGASPDDGGAAGGVVPAGGGTGTGGRLTPGTGGADFPAANGASEIRGLSAGFGASPDDGGAAGGVVPPGGGAGIGGRLRPGTGGRVIGGADFLVSKGVIDIRGLSAGFGASPDDGGAAGGVVPAGGGTGTGGRLTPGTGGADFPAANGASDIRGLSAGFGASPDDGGAAGGVVPPGGGAGTGGRLTPGTGGRVTGIGGTDFLVSKGVIDIRGLAGSAGGGDAGAGAGAAGGGTGGAVGPAGGAVGGGDGVGPGSPLVFSFSFGRGSWEGVSSLMGTPCSKNPPQRNQKDALAVSLGIRQETSPSMTQKRLLPAVLLGALVLTAGCHLFHHREKAAPELPPAAGVESEFRDRWIERRVHDLTAANPNLTEAEARQTAAAEFAKQFPYVSLPAPKPAR